MHTQIHYNTQVTAVNKQTLAYTGTHILHKLRQITDLQRRKTAARSRKHGRSINCFGNVIRLGLNESKAVFCGRRRGRSFHVEGPKTEKAREPTVESLAPGIWRLSSFKSRAENTGGCVELKTVAEYKPELCTCSVCGRVLYL